MSRYAVVGGGIAGLAAAYDLARGGDEVVLHEAGDRVGGKLQTETFAGTAVDLAPDAFLARRPEAVELCDELGLRDRFVTPASGSSYVWSRGALRPVPKGQVLGVPTDFLALARSGILSAAGVARAALEPWLPGHPLLDDATIGAVIAARYGRETLERLVDPLLGGINAGDTDLLSIDTVAPQIAAAARADRSLTRALRPVAAVPPTGPLFYGLRGGMTTLVGALVAAIESAGGRIETGSRVGAPADLDVAELDVAELDVAGLDAADLDVDGVVWAIPRPDLVAYSSVTLVLFAYPDHAVTRPLDASGFLVPRTERLLMTACSWASTKWAHLAAPGRFLLRVSAGRFGDDRAAGMTDAEVVSRLREELALTMGVAGEPVDVAVHRWPQAFPQYAPRHLDRLREKIAGSPSTVSLAGAVVSGVGIPACIGSGRAAAARLRARAT
jgi:oxygen-dependent protoporphyrinogen oxidase